MSHRPSASPAVGVLARMRNSSTFGCAAAQRRWNTRVCCPIADHTCPMRSRVRPLATAATSASAAART